MAPGIPSIADQEKRDQVPTGVYQRLVDEKTLRIAEGVRVQPPAELWQAIVHAWGVPHLVVCDRFRISEMQDCIRGDCPIDSRMTRWSESSADIRDFRRGALDGGLTVEGKSKNLIEASLAGSVVENDSSGNSRLRKKGANNTARDDVAAAMVLASGARARLRLAPVDYFFAAA